ncbi:MAG: FliH/SctL family protein [Desulfobulbaceae bacterium]|nr:FliH/SctL family protein [Desulfobulbaceae bacterium]
MISHKQKSSPELTKIYKKDSLFTPLNLITNHSTEESPESHDDAPTIQDPPQEEPEMDQTIIESKEIEPKPLPEQQSENVIDAQAIRDEAYQLGFIDAQTEVRIELENALNGFTEVCRKLDVLRSTILLSNRENMINIIMTMCRKIIKQELSIKRDFIATTLESAVTRALQSDEFHITLHPNDLDVAERIKPSLLSSIRGLKHIEIKTDPNIHPGGCLIDSEICTVDATIEGQLEASLEFLQNHLPKSEEPKISPPPHVAKDNQS